MTINERVIGAGGEQAIDEEQPRELLGARARAQLSAAAAMLVAVAAVMVLLATGVAMGAFFWFAVEGAFPAGCIHLHAAATGTTALLYLAMALIDGPGYRWRLAHLLTASVAFCASLAAVEGWPVSIVFAYLAHGLIAVTQAMLRPDRLILLMPSGFALANIVLFVF